MAALSLDRRQRGGEPHDGDRDVPHESRVALWRVSQRDVTIANIDASSDPPRKCTVNQSTRTERKHGVLLGPRDEFAILP
jgi:hypothetical protein